MKKSRYTFLYYVLALFILSYLLYKLVLLYSQSLFVYKGERINFVMYGKQTAFYSLDKQETRNYVMYFYPDLKMQIPGGYGNYRIGSLGKLAKLDNEPDIFKKTFSIATTSLVHFYYYPNNEEVFYGREIQKKPRVPVLKDILFMPGNAGFFDRMYLAMWLFDKHDDDFKLIAYGEEKNKIHNDVFFQEDSFIKNSIGLLFQKQYRDEQKNIQLQYSNNYEVAERISSLLEGNGIRVNDITLDMDRNKKCMIIENSKDFSQTSLDMSHFFKCNLVEGKTDVYDIIFVLGSLEKEWEL